jgi:hypothetical protein
MRLKNLLKTFLFSLSLVLLSQLSMGQSVVATLRPSHIDITSATNESAVLMTISGYPQDDARYRLYNGSNQYNCWNPATGTYITSNSYASGPQIPGTPSSTTTFWIPFQIGTNPLTAASYRDRLGTAYSANYQTLALPAATAITSPVTITKADVTFSTWSTFAVKYVVLGFSEVEGGTLIAATSSALSTGAFSLIIPEGFPIKRIEVRTLLNVLVESVTGTWPSANSVFTPIITPGTSTFYGPHTANVTITSGTDDAAIYYTTNGDVPTESSTLYTGPIPVSVNTTIKARGYKAGLDPSSIATATYTFEDAFVVSNIAELRASDADNTTVYRLDSEAIVAYPRVARGQKYIQDATASILIDDNDGKITSPFSAGDGITGVTGKLSLFNGMLQFVPVQDPGAATSTGNAIVIENKTLASLTEADQAKLVRVPNVTFGATGNFTIATDFIITDPSKGEAKFRTTFSEANYVGTPIPTVTLKNLIAFVNFDTGAGFRLTSRNSNDFVYVGTNASLSSFTVGGIEVVGLLGIEVSDPEVEAGATLFVPNFTDFEGIVATPADEFATIMVSLNGVEVDEADLATQTFANNDVVVVSVTAEDGETMKYYKVRVSDNASAEAEIVSFTVSGIAAPAEINSAEGTVSVNVLFGTIVTNLEPIIVISNGATIDPASGVAQDFTNPVVYTVTAENTTTTKEWTATVTVLPASNQAEILTFSFAAQSAPATINTENATVSISVVYGTNVTSLSPTITVSPFAGIVPASGVSQNFSAPVQYTVTAQDGTEKVWTVTVTISDPVIVPIYNIQYTTAVPADSPYKEQSIFTQGIVTAWHYAWEGTPAAQVYKGYFLQDGTGEWNGIRVYNTSTTTRPNVGDLVRIKGTVKEQFYNTEINSVTNETVILSTGNELPAVSVVTTLDANSEKWEGVLVKVVNANCTNNNAGFGMATINDGSGQVQVDDDIYKHTFTNGVAYNVTGVVYYSFNEQKILPRSAADVLLYTSSPTTDWKSGISAYPNPFTSSILVDNAASIRKYSISNIIGQQLVSGNVDGMSQIEIGTENLPQGIYLITFENVLGEKAVRKMIKK